MIQLLVPQVISASYGRDSNTLEIALFKLIYMPMSNIVLIKYEEVSSWMSCEIINDHLTRMYSELYCEHNFFIIKVGKGHFENWDAAKEITSIKPDHLIFIDHRFNPCFILELLEQENLELNSIKISMHIYGHAFEKYKFWHKCLTSMKGLNVRFITSSEAYKRIFSSLFENPPPIYVASFPVDESFKYENLVNEAENCQLTQKLKEKYKDKVLFLYTGRVSPEKNVHILINYVKQLREKNKSIHLIVVGPFDDMNPYMGPSARGSMNTHIGTISAQVEKVDSGNEFIEFIPKLSEQKLKILYLLSDYYFSFSTMTGEDFAMSVAEAACAGLELHLTDWAAHKDHAVRVPSTTLYPVKRNDVDSFIEINHSKDFVKVSRERRLKNSNLNYENYSFRSISHVFTEHSKFSDFKISKHRFLWLLKRRARPFVQSREYMEYYSELF